jgi:hypothetical protein
MRSQRVRFYEQKWIRFRERRGAFERLALLDAEAEHRERAEAALAQAAKRTLDLLSEIGPIRESAATAEAAREVAERAQRRAETAAGDLERRAAVAETQATELERRAAVAEAQVVAFEVSTTWRLTAPLRVFIGARPRFHGLLRRGRRIVAVALGRRR